MSLCSRRLIGENSGVHPAWRPWITACILQAMGRSPTTSPLVPPSQGHPSVSLPFALPMPPRDAEHPSRSRVAALGSVVGSGGSPSISPCPGSLGCDGEGYQATSKPLVGDSCPAWLGPATAGALLMSSWLCSQPSVV